MKQYQIALHSAAQKATLFLNRIFTTIELVGPELGEGALPENPVMVVSSHRSHLDYILIGMMLDKVGLRNLRFAAGDNLTNMPYVGKNFRAWGAFSVYRSQATKRSYILKLAHQVVEMLETGDNIIVFPEGGRSYSGKMLEMKTGIIASNIFAAHKNPSLNPFFLPIAVSYERLPEIRYFDILNKGKMLLKENPGLIKKLLGNILYFGADLYAFALFLSAPWFRRKYGKVYIDIGKPLPLSEVCDIEKNFDPSMKNEFSQHKKSLAECSTRIQKEIIQLYRILPMHILAAVLKKQGPLSRPAAVKAVAKMKKQLAEKGLNLKTVSPLSPADIVRLGIRQLKYTKSIKTSMRQIRIKKQTYIDYYAAATE